MDKIIRVRDLSFEYEPGLKTIDHISFDIEQGDYVAILGHNGSGKSTIAKLLIGLLEKSEGSIIINDDELNLDNLYKVRDNIGIVFQNPDNQFIGATVRDDIAFGLENNCVPQEDMGEIINIYASKVGMSDFLDHEPTKLSGGQKQRVAIAGILAMNPKIIILDEATSMLDPMGRREINTIVKELNQKKAKMIYEYLDESRMFHGTVDREFRSMANATFTTGNINSDMEFVEESKKAGFVGLKGHRFVGGVRASLYNAIPVEHVEALVKYMKEYESVRMRGAI